MAESLEIGGTMQDLLKVLAYVTRERADGELELLVFRHEDNDEAGLQVPAGTVEPNEDLAAAVQRELAEESGLRHLQAPRLIHQYRWCNPATGRWHHRHVFHFRASANIDDRWRHNVTSDAEDDGLVFVYEWLLLPHAELMLIANQGDSIRELCRDK